MLPTELVVLIVRGKVLRQLCKQLERWYMYNARYRIQNPKEYEWLMDIPNLSLYLRSQYEIHPMASQLQLRKLIIHNPDLTGMSDRLRFIERMSMFTRLTNLELIVCSCCYRSAVARCLEKLTDLTKLKFGYISDEVVPEQILQLTKLEKLDLWQVYLRGEEAHKLTRLINLKKIVLCCESDIHPSQQHMVVYKKHR